MNHDNARFVGNDQVKLLLAIAAARSFSGAAAMLGVSQPSISQQVKRLETLVGRSLFRRTRTGVEPTVDGEAVIVYGRAMQGLTHDLQRHLRETAGQVSISIGMSEDFVRTALPRVLWLFMQEHPQVDLQIVSGSYEALTAATEAGTVDLAVMRRCPAFQDAQLLWREPAIWVGSHDLPKPLADPVPLVLPIAPSPVRETIFEVLRAARRTWKVRFESASLASIEAAMQARLGICAGPRSMRLYGGVGALDTEIHGLPKLPDVEFVLFQVERSPAGAVTAFAEILRQVAAQGAEPVAG